MSKTMAAPAMVDSTEHLTAEWFTAALRTGEVIDTVTSVSKARAEVFGTGQFGLVVRAELDYRPTAHDAPRSLIVKLPSSDSGSRQLGTAMGAYEAEVRFYQKILPRVAVSAPRLYWGDIDPATGRFTLLIEDLSADWRVGDVVHGGTFEQARAGVAELVNLHAPFWGDQRLAAYGWLADPGRTQFLFDQMPAALAPFRERFGPRISSEHLRLVEQLLPQAPEYPVRAWTRPHSLMHGDYRLDNLLFQDTGTGLRAAVLDWQAVRLGPPLIDLCMFLGSCFTSVTRREHQDELLHQYHDGLLSAGITDFSFAQCLGALRAGSLYPFLLLAGASVMIEQTERGDAMFAAMIESSADLVQDLDAATVLGE
ncbi:phosphotransferase [Mycobacterium sp.]|uniref:phosphotransferase n=1 Tax=Mycobacterium sp. TaxID=1785 RepID=UPI0011F489A0|nr:phosphotransferase [Mycobacterium sp.]TAM67309.1 MAG: DUF1679 domain-containing protein [Mycobacterium sp.]